MNEKNFCILCCNCILKITKTKQEFLKNSKVQYFSEKINYFYLLKFM